MPRFVLLTHDHPFLHWDFMLERGDHLRTWRLSAEPDGDEEVTAEPLPDHRLDYLDYEGPVSGNRGEVRQWDKGVYRLLEETPERITVELQGARLQGRGVLQKNAAPNSQPTPLWSFQYEPAL